MTERPNPYRCILDRKFIIENICITCSQDGKCDYQSIYPVPVCATVDTVERYFETLHSDSCASHSAFNTPPERAAPEPDYSRHNPRIELRKVCEQEAHDAAIRQDEREKVLTQFADLIHNESVRLPPAMVDMVYSYRVAQIITTYRNSKQERAPFPSCIVIFDHSKYDKNKK